MSGRAHWAVASATAALLFAISSAAAFGQDSTGQVRIQGGPIVMTEAHSRTGIPTQTVQLAQNVDFADLDLATPAGANELRHRVHDTASSICEQLVDYPTSNPTAADDEDQRNCVNTAVDNAMGQVRRAIASAQNR